MPLGDLEKNLKEMLTGDCLTYTNNILAEAAKLFAGDKPHIKTIMEGYHMVMKQNKVTFDGYPYDSVFGDLFTPDGRRGEVTLRHSHTFNPSEAQMEFWQKMYAFKFIHEITHLGKAGGYSDEQMARAAHSYAKTQVPEPSASLNLWQRTTSFSNAYSNELEKHCKRPIQPSFNK